MRGHRRRRATQRSPATPISPEGGGGTASISLSLLLPPTFCLSKLKNCGSTLMERRRAGQIPPFERAACTNAFKVSQRKYRKLPEPHLFDPAEEE